MDEDKKNNESLFDLKKEEVEEEGMENKKSMDAKKIKNLIALSVLLGGLFLGSVFVDVVQLVRGSGFSQRALEKMDIFELGAKTWVAYPEPMVKVQVVSDETCEACAPEELLVWLKRYIPTILTEKIEANSESGQAFIAQNEIKSLPTLIFSLPVEKTEFFQQAQILFSKKDDKYILNIMELGMPVGKYLETPKLEENDIKVGSSDAKVKIVEFVDFQCPYCKAFHTTTLKKTLSEYGDKILYVAKNIPLNFHSQAENAAMAAECANEQGKFAVYADKLFNGQDVWGKTQGTQSFKVYAQQTAGMNVAQFNQCMDDKKYQDKINKDKNEAASFGITGTPAIFVNDQFVTGAVEYEAFEATIDAELAK